MSAGLDVGFVPGAAPQGDRGVVPARLVAVPITVYPAKTQSIPVPKGATLCCAILRGPGSFRAGDQFGGGGAEEFIAFPCAPGQTVTVVTASGNQGSGVPTTIALDGKLKGQANGGAGSTPGVGSATAAPANGSAGGGYLSPFYTSTLEAQRYGAGGATNTGTTLGGDGVAAVFFLGA